MAELETLIKVEVKEEYEEDSFSDEGCSFDTSSAPYCYDGELEIKDEPCDIGEECKQSVKLEIKEEFQSNDSGKNDFSLRPTSKDPKPIKRLGAKKIKVKKYTDTDSLKRKVEYQKSKLNIIQKQYELKKKVLEAKRDYYLALRRKHLDSSTLLY